MSESIGSRDIAPAPSAESALEPISVGSCPKCGGPAQFIDGGPGIGGFVRHVHVVRPVSAQELAEMIAAYLACPDCADGEGAEVCAAHLEFFTEAFRA